MAIDLSLLPASDMPLVVLLRWLQFLLSDIFPEVINHKIVKPVFAIVVTLLFVCPQVGRATAQYSCTESLHVCICAVFPSKCQSCLAHKTCTLLEV